MQMFEMMMNAIGRKQRSSDEGENTYYEDLSEQWAFRHFTPSVLTNTEGSDQANLENAKRLNGKLAEALAEEGEPTLGIAWADLVPTYRSPKFFNGVFHLTLLLHALQEEVGACPVHIFEIGAGHGSMPRLLAGSRQRLLGLREPVNIQAYAAFDVRSVTDVQHWYLRRVLGTRVELRTWPTREANGTVAGPWTGDDPLWAERPSSAPLLVDLVDRVHRDIFAHLYGVTHDLVAMDPQAPNASECPTRPLRALIAVNSWHEMPQTEWLWYYNEFVTGPSWRMGVDWILYISNQEWDASASKEALLLQQDILLHFIYISFLHLTSKMLCFIHVFVPINMQRQASQ